MFAVFDSLFLCDVARRKEHLPPATSRSALTACICESVMRRSNSSHFVCRADVYTNIHFRNIAMLLSAWRAQVFYTACRRANVPQRATQLLFACEQLVELYAEDHGKYVSQGRQNNAL